MREPVTFRKESGAGTTALLFLSIISQVALGTGCGKKHFNVTSSSMSPTINSNEIATVDMNFYRRTEPQRWDVVLFHPPPATGVPNQFWVMRIVGLPNELLELHDGGILVGGEPLALPARLANIRFFQPGEPGGILPQPISYPYKIPEDTYFLCGDNPTNAFDSRYWGSLSKANIRGKVVRVITTTGTVIP